jgi:hypothetical protein
LETKYLSVLILRKQVFHQNVPACEEKPFWLDLKHFFVLRYSDVIVRVILLIEAYIIVISVVLPSKDALSIYAVIAIASSKIDLR